MKAEKPNQPEIIALLNSDQIAEFEAFILEIPGKFSNPILSKFNQFKRVVLNEETQENESPETEAKPETEKSEQ